MEVILKAYFIVNPISAGGKTGKKIHSFKSQLDKTFEFYTISETSAPGHATELAREAISLGYTHIYTVGGDGTFNEVVNGYLADDKPINPNVILSIIPAGTGGDFRRNFGLETNIEHALKQIEKNPIQLLDAGKCTFKDGYGALQVRYFDNVASIGVSDAVAQKVNDSKNLKKLGGTLAFLIAGISSIIRYERKEISLMVDDIELGNIDINLLAVSNGKYFGGGMKIAPNAILDDGFFDVILLADFNPIEMLMNNGKVYYGGHVKHNKVKQLRAKRVRISSKEKMRIELDGETPGFLPATFEILPKVIRFK